MTGNRQLFFKHLAQTSPLPLGIEISHAAGMYLYGPDKQKYLDLISGIAVSNLGHQHPAIIEAITRQANLHLHLLVYGELVQSVQVQLAHELALCLPDSLSRIYFTNSGAEAVEGALKLAKRFTKKLKLASFRKAYHGSTQGALSICGEEWLKNSFRPLLPGTILLNYNDLNCLSNITAEIAAVVVEPIQAEAGIILPANGFMKELAARCKKTGTLLIFDEIQTGMHRTGSLFAFQNMEVIPDILLLGKGFGGGMPLGAFIASPAIMNSLTHDPVLGHITTFGGHPLSCAAALANLIELKKLSPEKKIVNQEQLFRSLLIHPEIRAVRGQGLFLALEFSNAEFNQRLIQACLKDGLLTDWFLFAPQCLRIAPPLIITDEEIRQAGQIIISNLNSLS